MAYADDPARVARLLRELADALVEAGVNPNGATPARHLIDDAKRAARELDPPKPGKNPQFYAF